MGVVYIDTQTSKRQRIKPRRSDKTKHTLLFNIFNVRKRKRRSRDITLPK